MKLEICASNFQSAINAEAAGAHRIELCTELAVGGLTPSYGLIKRVINDLKIPVHILIRPRSGSFVYTADELNIMKSDIEMCKELGCEGIASGVLNEDRTIDTVRTQDLIETSKPMSFTFHRAFDQTPDPFNALNELINIKADRILTSGQSANAEKGIVVLNQLLKLAYGQTIIMPGSGINPLNCLIFLGAGFEEIHASATQTTAVCKQPDVAMNSSQFFDETISITSSPLLIAGILEKINGKG